MKKQSVLLLVVLIRAAWCFSQASGGGSSDPWTGCQASFDYYYNDSIMTFAEAYPYRFIDLSKGRNVKREWDFGDGQTSSEKDPMHFYLHAGDTVTVCLTITTTDSCVSSYCTELIVGNRPSPPDCSVDFDIAVMESYPPKYRFIPDIMQKQAYSFWDFGDGNTSYETSPIHEYEYTGNYNVCLQTVNSSGCASYTCKVLQATGSTNGCKAAWQAFPDMLMDPALTGRVDSSFSPLARYYYFQDLSKGGVVSWHWDFGDGTVSKEQNPVHAYEKNGVYLVCLEIQTTDSCKSSYCDTLYAGVVRYCSLTGTVIHYTGLDGCGLLIQLDTGELLEPAEMVPEFILRNGQRVRLAYTELNDRAGICMAGKIVRIDCIEELTTGYCKVSFNHYPLPWVSSLPPIYQFEALLTGDVPELTWDFGDGTVTNALSPTHRYQKSGLYNVCLTVYTADGCTSTYCETSFYEGADPQSGLCDHYLRLNTEIILNGQICNGMASAWLVDQNGAEVQPYLFNWSTGETGPVIYNLCPGTEYFVVVTDSSGCTVSGSFGFGGVTVVPDSLFGFWNFQQDDKDFYFNIPVYSDSIYCRWDFGDGVSADGTSVNHSYASDDGQMVILRIYDVNGNLLYQQQIPVVPGMPSGIGRIPEHSPEVYPIPADLFLNVKDPESVSAAAQIVIVNPAGQVMSSFTVSERDRNTLQIDISALPDGYYIGKLVYHDGTCRHFRFIRQSVLH